MKCSGFILSCDTSDALKLSTILFVQTNEEVRVELEDLILYSLNLFTCYALKCPKLQ